MTPVLPYPDMDFVPLDQLTANELDQMVQNDQYLRDFMANNMAQLSVVTTDPGEGSALAANTLLAVVSS